MRILILFWVMMLSFVRPVRAEIQDWKPDSDSWWGAQLKRLQDMLGSVFKRFFDSLKEAVWNACKGIYEILLNIWQQAKEFFGLIWSWLKEAFELLNDLLGDLFDSLWRLLSGMFSVFCEWLLSWFWWYLKYSIDLSVSYVDWLISVSHDMLLWILERLPAIQLPAGFEEGLRYFIAYGLLLDRIFPVTETLVLVELYVTIYIALIVHGYTKSFWRWIGWFNK